MADGPPRTENVSEWLPHTDAEADLLKPEIGKLLRTIPEIWAEFDLDALTAIQGNALFLLTAAGMVERRGWLRSSIANHPTSFEVRLQATGERGLVEAVEHATASEYATWGDAWQAWLIGETRDVSPFRTEAMKPQEWRLTKEGVLARNKLAVDAVDVLDFVLIRGLYGPGYWVRKYLESPDYVQQFNLLLERQIAAGQDLNTLRRPPVHGFGRLVEYRKIEKPAGSQAVNLTNWAEGADALAAAFGKMVGPMFEAISKNLQANTSPPLADDQQPTADATQLPPAPSSLAELSEWIRQVRELLRGQEGCTIGNSGIGQVVREHFLGHLELVPEWPGVYHEFRPDKFQTIRELVAMMANVVDLLESSKAPPENQDKTKLIKGFAASLKPEWLFVCRGTVYEIAGCGERVHLEWMVGLNYIEKLLRPPREAIGFAELVADTAPERATEAAEQTADESLELDEWSDQPALDRQALREYYERLKEIETELEDARQCNDSGRQERLGREKEEILAAVQSSKGLGDNTRNLNSDADKLRSRISMALGRAYKKMANQAPKLAQHFRESISAEGGAFKYAPKLATPPWSFDQE